MIINKVLFSCSTSPEYAPFWNVQSEIFARHMQIEPVCLLYGKKDGTGMSEKWGKIIEVEPLPDLPWALQMTWSKFNFPTTEPDTTWLIGDIDLVPLQSNHFKGKIADIPGDAYVHLNAGGISQPRRGNMDAFLREGSQRHLKDAGVCAGADLPGHYHVVKGSGFRLLTQDRTFEAQVRHIIDSGRYGMGVMGDWPQEKKAENPYWWYWCAEENYSSELIFNARQSGAINFVPVFYNNCNATDRLNRDEFRGDYTYNPQTAAAKGYVDVHCARPTRNNTTRSSAS
jgi:hypothetical protein